MTIWFWLMVIGVGLLMPTAYAGLIGAPYAPTRIAPVRKAFELIGLNAEDTLVDLGVGDGKIVIEAARRGAHAYGYELSPILWAIAKMRTQIPPTKWNQQVAPRRWRKPVVKFGNFYNKNFPDATVIFCFLMPDKMPRLRQWLKSQNLPKAKYILCYAFPFKDITPQSVIREPNAAPVYIYDISSFS